MKLWDLDTQHCFHTIVGHRSEVIKRGGVGGILGCEVYVFVSWYCKPVRTEAGGHHSSEERRQSKRTRDQAGAS